MHKVIISRGDTYRQEFPVQERMTIREWVSLNIGEEFDSPMICIYKGSPLLRKDWEITFIETVVIFIPLALGGGDGEKNPLAMIGMVIVMVVAYVLQQYWTTPLWVGGLTAGTVAAAGVMIGGSLLINAIFPTKPPDFSNNIRDLESASPTYSLSNSQNSARLYQMIPESFGTNEQTPDLAAQPWSEFSGNEQYLHMLLCLGLGEYEVKKVSIEDTTIWENGESTENFPEIELEIVNPGEKITLFPDNIESSPEVSGQTLNQGIVGPFVANSSGTVASAIGVDIVFTRGLGKMNKKAGGSAVLGHRVEILFEYQYIDDFGYPISDWSMLFNRRYSASTQTPQRYTILGEAPDGGYMIEGPAGQDIRNTVGPFKTDERTYSYTATYTFPNGLIGIDDYIGNDDNWAFKYVSISRTVIFETREVDYSGVPLSDWVIDYSRTHIESTFSSLSYSFTITKPDGIYEIIAYSVPGTEIVDRKEDTVILNSISAIRRTDPLNGRFMIRGTVTSGGQEDPYLLNEVAWTSLKAYLPSKLVYPDITLIAIRARATNSLSQASSRQFRVVHTRKVPIWNPDSGWSELQPTNSWSWAMASMSKASWGGRRTDRQIDLNALYKIDKSLSLRGDEFNHVLDMRQSIWDLFIECCRCVRVIPRSILSMMSWVRDEPGRPVRGVFTPYNIIRDSFSVDYKFFTDDSPDDVFIEYRDRDGWTERDVRAVMPDSLSLEPIRKKFTGITIRQQAYNEAYFEASCNAYRRIFINFSTEMEGRLLFRGDIILITHPLGGESSWASIRGWKEEDSLLFLDTELLWDKEDKYYVVLRKPNGMPYGPVKVSIVKEKCLVLDTYSLSQAEEKESTLEGYVPIWDWLSSGSDSVATSIVYGKEEPGIKAIILSVNPQQNGTCSIEALMEDERVYIDPGDAPPWNPSGEVPIIEGRPTIEDLLATFNILTETIYLSWAIDTKALRYHVQYRSYSDGDGWSEWNDIGEFIVNEASFGVPINIIECRVRGISSTLAGPWSTIRVDCSVPMPERAVLELTTPYVGTDLNIKWGQVFASSIDIYLIVNGEEVARRVFPGEATEAIATEGELLALGGPWDQIIVIAISRSGLWPEVSSDPLIVVRQEVV